MEKEQRNRLQKTTQDARKLLEEEFRSQLLQTYDIDVEKVRWAEEPGAHLQAEQRLIRDKLIAWIEHKEAQINDRKEALLLALREMAFTALNRFVALKLMEARELVRPCVSGGLESAGFLEFTAVAQGLLADQESSYRLYLETIFEDVSRELRALFDPRDPASLLWPKRTALLELLEILNRLELAELWIEDETLGWVYQYFNGDAERKKMREESAAPRNSRELAVRNQFFTPRYVVEFLTDNTLGRIWYEMRQGNTGLKDQCRYLVRRPNEVWLQPGEEPPAQPDTDETPSQEELLRQPVYIPHRPLKDPREIRMLDPACGSMHFGLYSFDLYLEIYAEAWEIAHGSDGQAKQGELFTPFVAYAAGFASKAAFLREVPRLILHHNIHGIDIDPRATQIARLTLWLRAQRAWNEQKVDVASRCRIARSNVACAEPMPGEAAIIEDFVQNEMLAEERGLYKSLIESIVERMEFAGEAGSLLRIEEDIQGLIEKAKLDWDRLEVHQPEISGFPFDAAVEQQLPFSKDHLLSLAKGFWDGLERRIYEALRCFSEKAEGSSGFQRRLFAEDAAAGFAFIDVCSKKYEVIVMNPPFGEFSKRLGSRKRDWYPETFYDILSAFTVRFKSRLSSHGLLGAITSRTGFFLPSHLWWRKEFLARSGNPILLADLGEQVMDGATVESAAYVLSDQSRFSRSPFFRLLGLRERDKLLLDSVASHNSGIFPPHLFLSSPYSFAKLRGAPLAYWVPEKSIEKLQVMPRLVPDAAEARQGLVTGDAERFVRLFWEVPVGSLETAGDVSRKNAIWFPYVMRGSSQPWFSPLTVVVNWARNGFELRNFCDARGNLRSRPRAMDFYFRPGISWTRRAVRFIPYIIPAGCIPSASRYMAYPKSEPILVFLGMMATNLVSAMLRFNGEWFCRPNFLVENLKSLPWIVPGEKASRILSEKVSSEVLERRLAYTAYEPFPEFILPAELRKDVSISSLTYSAEGLLDQESEDLLAEEYGLDSFETAAMLRDLEEAIQFQGAVSDLAVEEDDSGDDDDLVVDDSLLGRRRATLSYFVGVSFGRWDVKFATGDKSLPDLGDPFAPLPVCPPACLLDSQASLGELSEITTGCPISIAWDGILVDDPSNSHDIVQNAVRISGVVFGGGLQLENEGFIDQTCGLLEVSDLRDYFRRPSMFFADHLKCYSKSRRQAPIYWQLSAGSGSYSAWLYYHRFTHDTVYRLLRVFVEPRIQQAEREQFELESQGALSGDAAIRLKEAQTLLQDIQILKSELDLVAPLWNPNLNDGVIINHAILWRITPYTPWQKKCKECWDKLVRGDYDWAHLAFHLWPERVILKCTTDRSLAIAHGLEERLWQETNNGNWLPRQLSEADLQALIAEHSNPAVKSALDRFLAAPPPVAPTRTRASRTTRASGSSTPRRARGSAAVVDAEATRQVLLALTAAPSDGLAKTQIADLIGVEANALTAVIKQLKESGQIDQLGERRGARYVLSEQGRAAVDADAGGVA